MPDNSLRVAVVIPVFNGRAFLGDCLDSVRAQSVACSIIAIDDASTDDSADVIQQRFPEVTLMRNPVNMGFAATVNLGLRRADDADFVLVLNQDTVLDQVCVARLIDAFGALPGAGILGCKILYPDGATVQHGGGWLRRPGAFGEHFGRGEADSDNQDAPREVEYVTGAAMMLSRAALRTLGGLDTGLSTAYFEDTDLCFRARAAGLGVWYWPEARLTHFEGSSIPKFSYQQHVYFHTGRTGFALRHWPPDDLIAFARAEQEASAGSGSLDDVLARSRAYLTHLASLTQTRRARDQIYAGAPNMRAAEPVWVEVTQRLLDARESALHRAVEFLEIPPAPAPLDLPDQGVEPARPPAADLGQGRGETTPLSLPAIRLQPVTFPGLAAPSSTARLKGAGPETAPPELRLDLSEFEFVSHVPVFGGLISAIRRAWHGVSGRWALLHAMRQQSAVNHHLAAAVRGLAAQVAALEQEHMAQAAASARATQDLADAVNRQTAAWADATNSQVAQVADAVNHQAAQIARIFSEQATSGAALRTALAEQRADATGAARAMTAELNGRLASLSAQLASQQTRYDALFREATRHENDLIRHMMREQGAAE